MLTLTPRRRAVIYTRISRTTDESVSLARQNEALTAMCDREGWDVVDVIQDDGLSGRKDRPNAERALDMLRAGQADTLLVWEFSRWSRQGIPAVAALIDVIDKNTGARFICHEGGIRSDGPYWGVVVTIVAEAARMEAESTQARIRAMRAQHLSQTRPEEQRFLGGVPPFGYRAIKNPHGPGKALAVDEHEAHVVRTVAERLIGGEYLASVTRWLDAEGVPTSASAARRARQAGKDHDGLDRGSWRMSTVRNLWRSETLLGRTTKREPVLGPDGSPVLDSKGDPRLEKRLVVDAAGIPINRWEPVLDLDTFARLQARFPGYGRAQPRRMASWLTDVVFCQACGGKLYVQKLERSRSVKRFFRCAGRGDVLNQCAAPATIAVDRIEAYLEEAFLAYGGHLPEFVLEERVEAPDVVLELHDVERATEDVIRAFRADGADYAALTARLDALKSRRRALIALPSAVTVVKRLTGRTLADVWADLGGDLSARREHLRQVIERAYVGRAGPENGHKPLNSDRVRIVWNPDREVDTDEGNSNGPGPDRSARRAPRVTVEGRLMRRP